MPKGSMTPGGSITEDTTTLHMALVGYEMEKTRIDEKIAEIRAHLGQSSGPGATKKSAPATASSSSAVDTSASNGAAPATKKRTMSASARKRIAAAQRKRWAEHRKNLAAGA